MTCILCEIMTCILYEIIMTCILNKSFGDCGEWLFDQKLCVCVLDITEGK